MVEVDNRPYTSVGNGERRLLQMKSEQQNSFNSDGSNNNNKYLRCSSSSMLYANKPEEKNFGLCRMCARNAELVQKHEEANKPKLNNGIYLSIILGNAISLWIPNSKDRFEFKKDYERFKVKVTIVIFCALSIALIFPSRPVDAICHFIVVWYYCTLTIRENILRLNGSLIKSWWVAHHYFACVVGGVALTWPDDKCYREFRVQFIIFTAYVAFVQQLQYYYQSGCLRRLNALGQGDAMDLTLEGFASWMFKGLTFLLPFLIVGYIFQFYNSYILYSLWSKHTCDATWQVLMLAGLFLILGLGNTIALIEVIIEKFYPSGDARSMLKQFKNKYPSLSKLQ